MTNHLKMVSRDSLHSISIQKRWFFELGTKNRMTGLPKSRKFFLILLQFALLFFISGSLHAQLSDLHYLPPLKQLTNITTFGDRSIDAQAIYFSTPVSTTFRVNVYKGTSSQIWNYVEISNTSPKVIRLTPPNGNNDITFVNDANTGNVLTDAGLRIESEGGEEFYVNFRGASLNQGSSMVSKGRAALGKKFRWGGVPVKYGKATNATLGMMATEDNTTIQISGLKEGIKFRAGEGTHTSFISPGTTYPDITLNKGESFVLEYPIGALSNFSYTTEYNEWMGASIVSNKDIAVSLGNAMYAPFTTGNTNGADRDVAFDQIIPEDALGSEYVFVRGYGSDDLEFPIIIATQNGTDIYINNSLTKAATIDAGEYYHVPGSNYSGGYDGNGSKIGENLYQRTIKYKIFRQ